MELRVGTKLISTMHYKFHITKFMKHFNLIINQAIKMQRYVMEISSILPDT